MAVISSSYTILAVFSIGRSSSLQELLWGNCGIHQSACSAGPGYLDRRGLLSHVVGALFIGRPLQLHLILEPFQVLDLIL